MDGGFPRVGHHGVRPRLQPSGRRSSRRPRSALPGAELNSTDLGPSQDVRAAARPPLGQVVAVALLAAGGLAYEIAQTRLLSALLISDWVAPVLAVALLGFGLGAAFAALFPMARSRGFAQVTAALSAVLAVLSLPAWLMAVSSGAPLLGLLPPLAAYIALGMSSAAILAWHPPGAAWLLRADYGAASVAAIATPWLMGRIGGGAPGAVLLAALLMSVAAVSLRVDGRAVGGPRGEVTLAVTALAAAAPLLGLLALAVGTLRVEAAIHMREKPISLALARGGTILATRWDATARTDLVGTPDGARYLYMDGGAGSLVPTPDPTDWSRDVGAFAFAMAPARSAFMIGTGGGLDVAQARVNGVEELVAVEVNPASVALVRDLGAAAGSVYADQTEVVIGDGRRVLAGRDETFDVITLANVVTGAAELRGAALTENRVYTVEAFEEYLAHLTDDGRLALKLYDELTLTRALLTALTALVSGGHAQDHAAAMAHVMAVLDVRDSGAVPVLVVRRMPFTLDEAVEAARLAEVRGWSLLLVPGLLAPPSLQSLADGEATLESVAAASGEVDLSPTYDAQPYFFSFEPGVPRDVTTAGLVAVALLVALALAALLAGPYLPSDVPHPSARSLLMAICLGAGFLLVELAALPVVQYAAGHPAWSLSLTLGAVLAGSAVGAHLAARNATARAGPSALVAALAVVVWLLVAPVLNGLLTPAPAWLAGMVVSVTLFLASVPMGLPFPRLLTSLRSDKGVAGALALSGAASVAASAGALWLSHAAGIPAVGWAAAVAYLLAAALAASGQVAASGGAREPA